VFHNFLCKYSNKALPHNFEEVSLIIDEYKKLRVDTNLDSLKVNKKKEISISKRKKYRKIN
jgi:hypothetical protein